MELRGFGYHECQKVNQRYGRELSSKSDCFVENDL